MLPDPAPQSRCNGAGNYATCSTRWSDCVQGRALIIVTTTRHPPDMSTNALLSVATTSRSSGWWPQIPRHHPALRISWTALPDFEEGRC